MTLAILLLISYIAASLSLIVLLISLNLYQDNPPMKLFDQSPLPTDFDQQRKSFEAAMLNNGWHLYSNGLSFKHANNNIISYDAALDFYIQFNTTIPPF